MEPNLRAGSRQNRLVTFAEARAQFPVLEENVYLQTGSVGPLGRGTITAMQEAEQRALRDGSGALKQFEALLADREALRADVAACVGADVETVALTASTTDGCNIVLAGLDLGPDDDVITTTDEHFGLLGPLHASGARVVVVPPDPDQIVAAVTPRTRLLALSHVLWTTGQVLPVNELRAQVGVRILVDGAQSVGAIAVDLTGLDYYTISGQKWLCGPEGTGALVVAEPDMLRVGRPSYLSQQRYAPDGAFEPRAGGRRFDPNVASSALTAGLRAALAALPDWRFERASEMAERCRTALRAAGCVDVLPGARATLVSWRVDADESAAVVARLADARVIVRDLPGRGLVRASVGWWTSDGDIERLVAAL
jgi:L-cysteine/cystine lyase